LNVEIEASSVRNLLFKKTYESLKITPINQKRRLFNETKKELLSEIS
jgi:hypothetical protein